MNILALDVGTSAIKAAILDVATANPVGPIARVSYDLDHPTPDAAELPTERVWEALTSACRQAVRSGPAVTGLGLSCLMPALVLLDAQHRPLRPIWTHLDRRARPVARQVWADWGERFLRLVGNRPLPGGISALCFKQLVHESPALAHEVKHYLHLNGWLGLKLTGRAAFDRGNACFTGLFSTMTQQQWSPELCKLFGVEPGWLPEVVCGSTTLGPLNSGVAQELGLPTGLPVKIGTADTSSAMLAANMQAGDVLHVVGTTQVLAALTDRPSPDARRLTRLLGVGTSFIQVTHNPVGGVALDWLHNLCFREQSAAEFYESSVPAALNRATPVLLEPPYLGGDRLEIEAHLAGFRQLTLSTDRLDLLAAVLQAMREQHEKAVVNLGLGTEFRHIFLTGGGADLVRQLLPSYRALPITTLEEGSLRGVAKLFG